LKPGGFATMLRSASLGIHWPLLVLAGLTMLAVRPLPSRLVGYADRAEALVRRFTELTSRSRQSPRLQPQPTAGELRELHAAFKALDWPDEAAAYHWAVNEAMRHDIAALGDTSQPAASARHRSEADRYWQCAQEEARRLTA
jgi:hypothetical protein